MLKRLRNLCSDERGMSFAFVGIGLMTLCVEWRRRPEQTRWLWFMAALAPVGVGLSYPAAFIGGAS